MKIAVAATEGSLEASVSDSFGRCPYFVLVDSETMAFEAFSNPAAEASGGAGPQAAQALVDRHVDVVLAGYVGPKAEDALKAAGISFQAATGTVREAVAQVKV